MPEAKLPEWTPERLKEVRGRVQAIREIEPTLEDDGVKLEEALTFLTDTMDEALDTLDRVAAGRWTRESARAALDGWHPEIDDAITRLLTASDDVVPGKCSRPKPWEAYERAVVRLLAMLAKHRMKAAAETGEAINERRPP